MSEQNPLVVRYLSQFAVGLKALPEAERSDIVREIESHIAEATGSGRSLAEVLERLGPADRLARAFAADAILGRPGRPALKWLTAAAVLMASSMASLFVIPTLLVIGITFPLAGVAGAIGNIVALIAGHPVPYLPHTKLGPLEGIYMVPVLGLAVDALIIPLGYGALVLLKRYIHFLIRTVRSSLS